MTADPLAGDPLEGDPLMPVPFLARTRDGVLLGRGVKPSLAPSLSVLDAVRADPSIRRLLFCGVGCAVHALRSLRPSPRAAIIMGGGYLCWGRTAWTTLRLRRRAAPFW